VEESSPHGASTAALAAFSTPRRLAALFAERHDAPSAPGTGTHHRLAREAMSRYCSKKPPTNAYNGELSLRTASNAPWRCARALHQRAATDQRLHPSPGSDLHKGEPYMCLLSRTRHIAAQAVSLTSIRKDGTTVHGAEAEAEWPEWPAGGGGDDAGGLFMMVTHKHGKQEFETNARVVRMSRPTPREPSLTLPTRPVPHAPHGTCPSHSPQPTSSTHTCAARHVGNPPARRDLESPYLCQLPGHLPERLPALRRRLPAARWSTPHARQAQRRLPLWPFARDDALGARVASLPVWVVSLSGTDMLLTPPAISRIADALAESPHVDFFVDAFSRARGCALGSWLCVGRADARTDGG
jgi:hypothetical protein